jgi:trans-2,3-dihydro-3-hydroxyanthranilate isomerase
MADFFLVDVFTDRKFTGNPLAVVIDSGEYTADQMQSIAREFNFSETTFAQTTTDDRAFPVRIFTPTQEIPFAGHPTLGTAWVLREVTGRADQITLALGVGVVSVDFERSEGCEIAWMQPPRPQLGPRISESAAVRCLGLGERDLHPSLPAQHVSIGVAFAMIPLASLDALGRINLDRAARAELGNIGSGPIATFVFSEQTRNPDHQFSARLFFEADGLTGC